MSSTEDMFKLLLRRKVDVVLTNILDGNSALNRLDISNVITMDKPLVRLSLYHYIHQNNKELVPFVYKEIQRMKSNGELASLILQAEKSVIQLNQQPNQQVDYPLTLSVE